MHSRILISLLFCAAFFSASAQKNITLNSPDNTLHYSFFIRNNALLYSVNYHNTQVILPSPISFSFANASVSTPRLQKPSFRDTTESYDLITGKASHVTTSYREVTIPVSFGKLTCAVTVRAFNDAIAWRYSFNGPSSDSLMISDENTSFRLAGNPTAKVLMLRNYTTSHEGLYQTMPYNTLTEDTLMDMPALFSFPGNIYLGITEAALLDYAGMYLVKEKNSLVSKLSPYPGKPGIKVMASYPHNSPWRVLLISNRMGALIESTVLTSLNAPCAIGNTSWIKPGKTTFPWWNGNVLPDSINAPGNNFATQKYYIDFCARNNIQYHSVVEYGLHQWYVDDGIPFTPGPHSDVTHAVPGLDMQEVCEYAHSKNVDIRVWVHWAALYPKLDSAFTIFEKWGISGMMVDFMDRDDQQMVNIQTEILQKAAQHHLHIQFHGAYKPTGLNRTYPNEFTREGTYNYENNKWGNLVNTDHDLDILFTRALAGSTDYHLGGFRFVNDSAFKIQFTRPLIKSTRCHMLAMYVVMESALGMVCDYPEAYEGQPGFEFITQVPTTWDETKVLDAKPDGYLVVARRKKDSWYIGAVGNRAPHELEISLSFLGEGKYTAQEFMDSPETLKDPNKIKTATTPVDRSSSIHLLLQPTGGAAIIISK